MRGSGIQLELEEMPASLRPSRSNRSARAAARAAWRCLVMDGNADTAGACTNKEQKARVALSSGRAITANIAEGFQVIAR